jgi:hypothetical protein
MEIALLVLYGALIKKAMDVLRYISGKDWNGLVSQVVVWAIAIGFVFLAAESSLFEHFDVNGLALGTLNNADLALFGLALGSGASVGWDLLRTFDNTQSAATPPLVKSSG